MSSIPKQATGGWINNSYSNNNSIYGNMHQADYPTWSCTNDTSSMKDLIKKLTIEIEHRELDLPLAGAPTNRELREHESLKNAYNEYLTVRKLVLGKI